MSPIDKISDIRWFPRLGKIHLGEKVEGQRRSYPKALDHFRVPEEVAAVHGKAPKELPVMFPSDDLELVAPQWRKCYSYSQGLICKGDGEHCKRKVDIKTGDFANRDTKEWVMTDAICEPEQCPMIDSKQCRKMMSLLFILHEVPGLGVYQLDTSSFYSIVNMNSQLAKDGFLRHFTQGRIAFIPLILSVEPKEVNPPGEGRKTVHVLNVRADVKLADIIRISRQKPAQVLLPTLSEEEPPADLYPEEVLTQEESAEQLESPESPEEAPPENIPEEDTVEGESLAIDLTQLNKMLEIIHWTEKTVKTWISQKWPDVSTEGKLPDILDRLTLVRADEFISMVKDKADKVQPELFD
jgi:hypothetical protein